MKGIPLFSYFSFFSGTGSKPEPPHGWQDPIRFIANQPPFNRP